MPLTYRRARGSDTWHFREDCAHWPDAAFDEEVHTPTSGVCCIECTYWPPSPLPHSCRQPYLRATGHRSPAHLAGC